MQRRTHTARRTIIAGTVLALVGLGSAACGSDEAGSSTTGSSAPAAADEKVAVTLITKDSINPFWIAMQDGAKQAAEAKNVDLTIGPAGNLPYTRASYLAAIVDPSGRRVTFRYAEKVYNETADLWRQDATLENSIANFKILRAKLGPVETRTLLSATEQQNSGGPLKGRAYFLTYRTKFQNAEGMETFTLVERDGRWLLARYFVNSTALK